MFEIPKWAKAASRFVWKWWAEMSGAISIPLGIIALFEQGHERRFFALTAFCALLVCAVRLAWLNHQLNENQKPKFKLTCRKNISACAVPNADGSMKFFRMLVETDCADGIEDCVGHLIKIEKDGIIIYDHDIRELPFAPAERDDCLAKTISPNISYPLDVLVIYNVVHAIFFGTSQNAVNFATKGHCEALDQNRKYVFDSEGDYILHVSVSGKKVPTMEAKLKFVWRGQWFTATMEKIYPLTEEETKIFKRDEVLNRLGKYQERLNERYNQIRRMEYWDYANANEHFFKLKAFDPSTQILLEEIENFLEIEIAGAKSDFKDTITLEFTPVNPNAEISKEKLFYWQGVLDHLKHRTNQLAKIKDKFNSKPL